jgi:hypothetical protein
MKIYINGTEEASYTDLGTTIASGTTVNAANAIMNLRFNGASGDHRIDELRIWSDVRTQDEIKTHMYRRMAGNEPNLVGYYRLDDNASAVTAVSFIHGGTNGTKAGSPTNYDSAPITQGE